MKAQKCSQYKGSANGTIIILLFFIASMTAASIFVVLSKKEVHEFSKAPETTPTTSLDDRMADLEKRAKVFEDRIWLLGIANNENSMISKKLHTSLGRPDPEYFIFDEKWKFNKDPSSVGLSDELKAKLDSLK